MFNEGFLLFSDVNDFDVIMIYQSVILSVFICYYTLYSLSVFSFAESLQLILEISPTYRSVSYLSSVAAARKVSPNWSLQTMTCHSSHCFSIVWG